MQKWFAIAISCFLATTGSIAYADDQTALTPTLTDSQLAAIAQNCASVQSTLTRIHSNDALSRVHLGQEYETISTKFMAPMNSRVALTKLNSVPLAKTTVDFNAKLDMFRSQYQQYEQMLLRAIQMKCSNQPMAFYTAIVSAQSYRTQVRTTVVAMGILASQYSSQVSDLRTQLTSLDSSGDSQ